MAKIEKNREEEPNQTELIQVRCSADVKGKLEKLAEKDGVNISKFVRRLITKKITASERPVTPTNAVIVAQEPKEWDKKAIQELFMILGTVLGVIVIFKIVTRW